MVKLIGQNQSSFIPSRDIVNSIIVAQEVVHSLKNFCGSKKGMILKINLKKFKIESVGIFFETPY